ncbi:MAG TPA: hypothetical protein VNK95_07755 [Caldilineaceae bacterium]|nr:hypothetical protein [Caldilineaceae bacterium]
MPTLSAALLLLGGFLAALLTLAWLSRQISLHIQLPVYRLTRSKDAPTLAIFLVFLPGVLVHEAAHWLAARLLGLKTGKFRVWPKRQGKHIGLGSVSVESRDTLTDSLVGMAPLAAGSALVALIGNYIFNAYAVAGTLAQGRILEGFRAFWLALGEPDGALWAYLLFAIANAMMPSASDREPVKPVLLYAGVAAALYLLLGLPLNPVASLMLWMTPLLENLSSAFLFTIVLDVAALAVLYLVKIVVAR